MTERLVSDLPVRDDACEVVARTGAPVFRHGVEIFDELADRGADLRQSRIRIRDLGPVAVEIGIGTAEELLRELQHARLVGLRHASTSMMTWSG